MMSVSFLARVADLAVQGLTVCVFQPVWTIAALREYLLTVSMANSISYNAAPTREHRLNTKLTDVVSNPHAHTSYRQRPEYSPERLCHAKLNITGRFLQVEGENYGHGHDGHVDGQPQVG